MFGNEPLDQQLVRGIAKRVQQTDRQCLDAVRHQATDDCQRFGRVERCDHPAGIVQPFVHLAPEEAQHQRFRVFEGDVINVVPSFAPNLQRIAKAGSGNKPGLGALALDDSVGNEGCAMDQVGDRCRRDPLLGEDLT